MGTLSQLVFPINSDVIVHSTNQPNTYRVSKMSNCHLFDLLLLWLYLVAIIYCNILIGAYELIIPLSAIQDKPSVRHDGGAIELLMIHCFISLKNTTHNRILTCANMFWNRSRVYFHILMVVTIHNSVFFSVVWLGFTVPRFTITRF